MCSSRRLLLTTPFTKTRDPSSPSPVRLSRRPRVPCAWTFFAGAFAAPSLRSRAPLVAHNPSRRRIALSCRSESPWPTSSPPFPIPQQPPAHGAPVSAAVPVAKAALGQHGLAWRLPRVATGPGRRCISVQGVRRGESRRASFVHHRRLTSNARSSRRARPSS
jgi:hypothetical protein